MAQKNEYVAAIDLGTTKVVALVGKKTRGGKLHILSHSKTPSKGIKRGVVLNIDETVKAIQETIEEVQLQSGIIFDEVFVGIAGQHIKSLRNRGYINRDSVDDEIVKEDIQALIRDMYKIPLEAGEEIIHVIPQSFIVDNEVGVKNPVGMSGGRLEANFHIVIGQVASAKNIEKCINRVGLKVEELILEPLASSAAVLTEDEMEAGVALIDIGGGTTDLAVYYDGVVRHTAVIPFGGNVITTDIKEGCSILQRQAEALKVQYGSALGDLAPEDKIVSIPGISGREPKEISFKKLANIIQSRMEEIIDAVAFEIESSGVADKLSAGIVVTGGGSLLRHLPQLINFKTGMDVRIGQPNEHLSADSGEEINHPLYSTAVGLVLKGFEYYLEHPRYIQDDEPEVVVERKTVSAPQAVKSAPAQSFEEEEPRKMASRKSGLFDSVKKKFTEIFEENDSEM
ncbi:cell division protein FtsA [Williamwhitmania taraxaci]|uniref:Cell division protein FtsA n=1 Tax=Williamwhitmania taraxaci TaxID=1640674 RepID=A0A1G6L6M6_9BACT|nr:cell division protein FtsA [Williamwhitmania taraxaci]SDC38763.1 cell division protein FtsA [Williamwhitmania taraxaci]